MHDLHCNINMHPQQLYEICGHEFSLWQYVEVNNKRHKDTANGSVAQDTNNLAVSLHDLARPLNGAFNLLALTYQKSFSALYLKKM